MLNYKKPVFWVIAVAVIGCVTVAVCFLTNPKTGNFSIKIVVPAGSQEQFVYSDEEVSPIKSQIILSSGDNLGDTEVILKPVEVKQENAYDEPAYLTPGMPLKLNAEKGAWFKIGVNVQNPTDEVITVYVNVENVEVRISSVTSTVRKWFDYLEDPAEMQWDGCLEINVPEFADVTFRWYPEKMEAVTKKESMSLYTGMPIWNAYFCDLTGDGLPELCSSLSFGSGLIDNRIILYDYANGASYSLEDRGIFDYTLRLNDGDGQLYVDKKNYNSNELVSSGRLAFEDDCIQIVPVETNAVELTAQQRQLMDRYPEYFGLDDSNGLDVYVWQLAENRYSFGLLPHSEAQRDGLSSELLNLQGTDAEEMRQILSAYQADENNIHIIPWQNPISSYLGEYWVVMEDESMEEKQEDYKKIIRNMLFEEQAEP